MAGTRLASHTFFLLFSLVSVLVAWRLGVVKRAPLPMQNMVDPYGRRPDPAAGGGGGGPRPPAIDVDVVLLRSPEDGGCPSCAAALDALQANPSLARNAFQAAEAATRDQQQALKKENGQPGQGEHSTAEMPTAVTKEAAVPLFTIREVNLRVVHADHGLAAGNAAHPLRAPPSDGGEGGPAALDDWLHRHFILPPTQQQIDTAEAATASGEIPSGSTSSGSVKPFPSLPRYTFFIACAGAGDAGELPTFIMGKHRHGYLGLGCACSSCPAAAAGSGSSGAASAASETAGKAAAAAAAGIAEPSPVATPAADARLASAAAVAVVRALAGIVLAHVLRSPVRAGDVHVRPGQAYRLNFSLLSEDPALRRCAWDFAAASRRYLRPLLRKLRPVASFAVQSQEVQYARLSPAPPRWYSSRKRWYYSPADLQGFLGANDFSTLDLAAGWGPDGGGSGSRAAGDGNATLPSAAASASSPHSQVPVNFMMFCPSPKVSPLVFMEDWIGAGGRNLPFTEAYEVPGFGGVSVVNQGAGPGEGGGGGVDGSGDGGATLDVLEPDRLRRAFGAHVSQLRRIIGLPRPSDRPTEALWPWLPRPETAGEGGVGSGGDGETLCGAGGSSCAAAGASSDRQSTGSQQNRALPLTFLPSPSDGVTDWEVDALLRAGMARNRAAAAETLRSLAALVESQPEMEVSSKIAEDVTAAIEALVNSDASVSESLSWTPPGIAAAAAGAGFVDRGSPSCSEMFGVAEEWAGAGAMRWAREALRRSEAAYFDPTMVPQLYFPQDHLMAVYFPFLAPLAFPLIFGFAQELLRYYRKRKKARERRIAAAGDGRTTGGDEVVR